MREEEKEVKWELEESGAEVGEEGEEVKGDSRHNK